MNNKQLCIALACALIMSNHLSAMLGKPTLTPVYTPQQVVTVHVDCNGADAFTVRTLLPEPLLQAHEREAASNDIREYFRVSPQDHVVWENKPGQYVCALHVSDYGTFTQLQNVSQFTFSNAWDLDIDMLARGTASASHLGMRYGRYEGLLTTPFGYEHLQQCIQKIDKSQAFTAIWAEKMRKAQQAFKKIADADTTSHAVLARIFDGLNAALSHYVRSNILDQLGQFYQTSSIHIAPEQMHLCAYLSAQGDIVDNWRRNLESYGNREVLVHAIANLEKLKDDRHNPIDEHNAQSLLVKSAWMKDCDALLRVLKKTNELHGTQHDAHKHTLSAPSFLSKLSKIAVSCALATGITFGLYKLYCYMHDDASPDENSETTSA